MWPPKRLLIVILLIGVELLRRKFNELLGPLPAPHLSLDEWWGAGEKPQDWSAYIANTSKVVGNRLAYTDETIDDLRTRLNSSLRLVEPLEGVGFEYGFNTRELRKLIDYWRDDYLSRWREREVFLWQFNHFTTEIQGFAAKPTILAERSLRMHYLHLRVYEENKVNRHHYPVLLLHGWPSSVREFYTLIHDLHQTEGNKNNKYVFDVVAPSLPGYAWSQGTSKPGMGPAQIAVIMRNLMIRLGYQQFFVQGGDWGSVIGSHIATLFPENVIGYHSNLCSNLSPKGILKGLFASMMPSLFLPKGFSSVFFPQPENIAYLLEESGYFHLQATKPDTIGSVLTDNPVGLAAYILEKFSTWTNAEYRYKFDGGLTTRFQLDYLLDNVMIYYLTNSITTSQRLYAEAYSDRQMALQLDRVPTKVPTGCARFKHDIMMQLDFQLRDKYTNLIHSSFHNQGGHFAAMEVPELLYNDFIEFIKKVEGSIKVK